MAMLKGCNILIRGSSNGAGLSSSAALEVLIGYVAISNSKTWNR